LSLTVFAVVLFAALLHASWNALVKGGSDKAAAMTAVILGQGVFGLASLAIAPLPAAESLPYLAGSVALHLGYNVLLIFAYKAGDLTQVYPIARGASPLIVALVTTTVFGATLDGWEVLGVLLISTGILSTSLVRRADGLFQGKAAAIALLTGAFIAGYSIVDGYGARVSGTALGYFGTIAAIDGLAFLAGGLVLRNGVVGRALARPRHLFGGGGASFVAYAAVIWAFTLAPIALVTALRETSIVFALVLGVGLLGERLRLAHVGSIALTIAGAVALRLHRG
jgi:drug/metabolite transporter (DMT)-like permease